MGHAASQPAKPGSFVSLRVRLLLAFGLLFSIIYAATFYWFLQFASQRAVDRLGEDLKVLIEAGAEQIDGDELKALTSDGDAEMLDSNDAYDRHMDWLETLKEIDPRATTYTMVQVNAPNEYVIVTDAGQRVAPDNPRTAGFGDPLVLDEVPPEFDALFHTQRPANGNPVTWILLEPYSDPYGEWISGYTVIWDSEGNPVGVLGADYNADFYRRVRSEVQTAAIPAFAITYLVLLPTVWAVSTLVARPLVALRNMAARVGEGDYDQDFSKLIQSRLTDEISILADVFRSMVDKVRTREESLKKQVAALKIQVDTVKQTKAVSEIVESDFFKDLKEKASTLRARTKAAGKEGPAED